MNSREKLVAVGVGVLIACLIMWYGVSSVFARLDAKEQQLQKLRSEVAKKKNEKNQALAAATRLKNYEERSLPDTPKAASLYTAWLIDATKKADLADVKVTSPSPTLLRTTASQLQFGLSARGELDKVVEFLFQFQQMDWLHRIENMSLTPQDDSKQIELKFTISALSLKTAPQIETLEERLNPSWNKDLAAYKDPILQRNFFSAPNRTPKIEVASRTTATLGKSFELAPKAVDPDKLDKVTLELVSSSEPTAKFDASAGKVRWTPSKKGDYTFEFAAKDDGWPSKRSETKKVVVTVVDPPLEKVAEVKPKKPVFDLAKYTVLTAVIDKTGQSEIWLHVRPENATRVLQVNDKFEIGSIKGVVSEIGVDDVIVTVDGKPRRLVLGDTLAAADSSD